MSLVHPLGGSGGVNLYVYYCVLVILFVLFLRLNGKVLDRTAAWTTGLGVLALAAVFPFLILVLGLFGTLVLYLTAAPLVGLSILAYRLKHLNGQSEESLPRPALPSPPAVAALAAAPGIPVLSKPAILKQASTPSRPPIPLGPAVSVAEDADSDGDSAAAPSPTAAEPAEEANAHAETASDIAEASPIAEEEPPDSLSPRNLVDKALAAASRLDFVEAVTLLNSALSQRPEPGLRWFIVGELSTIYQHLGQYRLADALIGAFLLNPPDTEHPLVPVLRQKQAFCRSLDRLLAHRGTPNLGYEAVPDELRRLAFLEATAGFRSH
ncbi:hypothetical protein ACP3TH_09365 [Desulforudis sp. 1031]|uniref:hypothetical protein n=3 Tax=unclassified Candidatus Desulforudis TaxID=2635950 RepID=UPI003CE4EC45